MKRILPLEITQETVAMDITIRQSSVITEKVKLRCHGDRNGDFELKALEKRQIRTDEIEQKIMAMYSKRMSQRDILGIWIGENEGESFYASICSDLKKRGVNDILVACHDHLKGLGEAVNAVFPQTKQQLCIVRQVRNSTKFVSYNDRKEICADLKKIYGAVNLDDAEYAKEEFREK